MEGLGVGLGIAVASLLLTIVGQRFHMSSDYVQAMERRLALAEKRADDAQEGHDKCDEDKEALKRVLEDSEREKNQKDRLISDLYAEIRNKDRQITKLGGSL